MAVLIGVLAIVAGAATFVLRSSSFGLGVGWIVLGVIALAGGFWMYTRFPQAAAWVEIGSTGVSLKGFDGESVRVSWADSTAKLWIYDFRSVPVSSRSADMKTVDFVIVPKARIQAPVPAEAVKAILEEAGRQGLPVKGWLDAPPSSGQARTIIIGLGNRAGTSGR